MNENPDLVAELYDLCMVHLYEIFNDEDIVSQMASWKYDMEHGEEYYELVIEEDD